MILLYAVGANRGVDDAARRAAVMAGSAAGPRHDGGSSSVKQDAAVPSDLERFAATFPDEKDEPIPASPITPPFREQKEIVREPRLLSWSALVAAMTALLLAALALERIPAQPSSASGHARSVSSEVSLSSDLLAGMLWAVANRAETPVMPTRSAIREWRGDREFAAGKICAANIPVPATADAKLEPADGGEPPDFSWFGGDKKPAEFIAQQALLGRVVVLVVGSHDESELKPETRERFGTNIELAQQRASCLAKALEASIGAAAKTLQGSAAANVAEVLKANLVVLPIPTAATARKATEEEHRQDRRPRLVVLTETSKITSPELPQSAS